MKKSFLYSVAVGFISLALAGTVYAQVSPNGPVLDQVSAPSFSRVKGKSTPLVFPKSAPNYENELYTALKFHNFIKQLNDQKVKTDQYRTAVYEDELNKRRLKDLNSCNVSLLAENFSNPDQVWERLKAKAKDMYTAYSQSSVSGIYDLSNEEAALLAASDSNAAIQSTASAMGNTSQQTNVSDSVVAQNVVTWDIGRQVLTDFYKDQDNAAWNAKRKSNKKSLPVWKDQEYLYNELYWKPKYKAIQEYCQFPVKEPSISDAKKYDYYFYNDVKAAHNKVVAAAAAKGCVLPPNLAAAPKRIDEAVGRPLPPVAEDIMILTNENNVFTSIYPGMPDPWKTYQQKGFHPFNESGEMSTYFSVSGGKITPKQVTNNVSANRLSQLFTIESDIAGSTLVRNEYKTAGETLKQTVEAFASENNVKMPKNLNYLKKTDLDKAITALRKAKAENLTKAQTLMGETYVASPTAQQLTENSDLAIINALQIDTDAKVTINSMNAAKIQDALKEADAVIALMEKVSELSVLPSADATQVTAANQELQRKMDAMENSAAKAIVQDEKQKTMAESAVNLKMEELEKKMIPLDKGCLNGGIKGSFKFSSIKVE